MSIAIFVLIPRSRKICQFIDRFVGRACDSLYVSLHTMKFVTLTSIVIHYRIPYGALEDVVVFADVQFLQFCVTFLETSIFNFK